MKALGQFVSAIVLATINIFLGGYAFITLWGWFVVTTFSEYSVEPLMWVQGYGLMILLGFIKFSSTDITDNEVERDFGDNMKRALMVTFYYLMVLGIGWFVSLYMPV